MSFLVCHAAALPKNLVQVPSSSEPYSKESATVVDPPPPTTPLTPEFDADIGQHVDPNGASFGGPAQDAEYGADALQPQIFWSIPDGYVWVEQRTYSYVKGTDERWWSSSSSNDGTTDDLKSFSGNHGTQIPFGHYSPFEGYWTMELDYRRESDGEVFTTTYGGSVLGSFTLTDPSRVPPPPVPSADPFVPPSSGEYVDLRTVDPASHTAWFEENTDHPEQSTAALAANVEVVNQDYLFETGQITETEVAQNLATYFAAEKDRLLAEHGPSDIASDFEFMQTVAQNHASGNGPVFPGGSFNSLGAFLAHASAWSQIISTQPFPAGAPLPDLLNVVDYPDWESYISPPLR